MNKIVEMEQMVEMEEVDKNEMVEIEDKKQDGGKVWDSG
jgi:hypothetical protein